MSTGPNTTLAVQADQPAMRREGAVVEASAASAAGALVAGTFD